MWESLSYLMGANQAEFYRPEGQFYTHPLLEDGIEFNIFSISFLATDDRAVHIYLHFIYERNYFYSIFD